MSGNARAVTAPDTAERATSNPIKLLLHCLNGSPPYLTPIILSKYFPPTDRLVRDHLTLGIELRDSCVVPVYGSRGGKKRNGQSSGSSDKSESLRNEASVAMSKPTGYTFTGRPISTHLCIPNEYASMACPSFDLLDNSAPNTTVNATNADVTLSTPNGYQKISPHLFCDVVASMEVPSCVALYDQASSPGKRMKRSVERTMGWLDIFLSSGKAADLSTWAPVVGGADISLCEQCLQHILGQKGVYGVALVGIHHISSREMRLDVMQTCVDKVPRSMPCAVLVANDIMQILDAALSGVQLIGSALPLIFAQSCRALVIDLYGWRSQNDVEKSEPGDDSSINAREKQTLVEGPNSGIRLCSKKHTRVEHINQDGNGSSPARDGCIGLDQSIFVRDTSPLVEGCACLACSHHMRAYVHHLINARELLAEILLFIHNLHHLLKLFEEVTHAIALGKQDIFSHYVESQLAP